MHLLQFNALILYPFADTNECSDPSTCGNLQQCFNTAGSYICECMLGYQNDPQSLLDCLGKQSSVNAV